ncbi:hypothetical protein AVEN_350-1 [Araneus ventricosus]|uniref:Uncharacterized protein n=1 Tax=Araneus ventricosus TaxID=182803 RepID=A0A4Y2PUQ6_ARAVE|nr:hypothetical protein AVEN_350-1 [Araneus ventricosus]
MILNRDHMTMTTPELSPPTNFSTTPTGERLATAYGLECSGPAYTSDLQWNRVSRFQPSGATLAPIPIRSKRTSPRPS